MPNNIAVTDLISSSLRLAKVLASGETATADEMNDSLLVLNDLLENLSTESYSVWREANQTFSLVPGQAEYTIGPGGQFSTVRPVSVQDATYITLSGTDFPTRSIEQKEYNQIAVKNTQGVPERVMYTNDFPLGLITVWPVPDQAMSITISAGRLLSFPVTLFDILTGPPGFTKMLRYLLAIELCPEFGIPVDPDMAQIAMDVKGDFKSTNIVNVESRIDSAVVGEYVATWQRGY